MKKRNTCILLFILIAQTLYSQNKNIFKIKTVFKSEVEINHMIKEIDSINDKMEFFEDEKYIVYSECRGEWGGAITFKNKMTKEEFICESTCPVTVNKFKNKYIVTNTLNHLMSTTEILEIANPEQLEKKDRSKKYNFEKLGKQGAKTLIDIYNFSTFFSFLYNDRLFHMVYDKGKTYIAEIIAGKFEHIQDLSEMRYWNYHPSILKTRNRILIALNNHSKKGYIEINGNEITLFRVI